MEPPLGLCRVTYGAWSTEEPRAKLGLGAPARQVPGCRPGQLLAPLDGRLEPLPKGTGLLAAFAFTSGTELCSVVGELGQ